MTDRNRFVNPEADREPISDSQFEDLIELQSVLLSAIVSNESSIALLEQLCWFAEKLTPAALASVMLLDKSGQQLFVRSAPSIPAEAIIELDGLKVGEGSCGNTIFYNEDMYVCDTRSDTRWENLQDFASRYNVNACWSSPIRNTNNQPVGSFSLSSSTSRTPDNFQRRLLNSCASIVGIILQREEALLEREKREKQLWESRQGLEATINSVAEGVIRIDSNGDIVLMNQTAERLTGWPCKRAVGQHMGIVFTVINSKTGEKIICDPPACITDGNNKCLRGKNNTVLVSTGGTRYNILMNEMLIKSETGDINGVVITFRDTTRQCKDRENLLATQQRYWSIMENIADPLYLVNQNGEFADVNQAACEALGYPLEELLRLSVPDINVALDHHSFRSFFDSLIPDHSISITGTHRRKDGTTFPVEIRLSKFISSGKPLIVSLAVDITHRKKEEEEILKAQKLDSIGLLAGGIAHDFNNLLGIILGNIDLAQRVLDPAEKASKYLGKATSASTRAADLTQQLLTFSKGGEPVRKSADIMEIIRESAEFSLHGSSVEVNYYCQDNLWNANVDSGQISQVIQNLVINARQAMKQGGKLNIRCENVSLSRADKVMDLRAGNYIKVGVEDSGEGIAEDIISSIFDPYFTTKQDGSGLGLALSYSIIQKHRGAIRVDSEPGRGTCFTIYLPAKEGDDVNTKTQTEKSVMATGNKRILIMDDDEMIREIGQLMLENLGYTVLLANDGETAIELYQTALHSQEKIDLVIMDLTVLSGMGGKEAIKQIQAIDPQVKALVSSGYSNDPVMANFKDYGFSGAVSKPYNQNELGVAVATILNPAPAPV